jgi:hypothetical protein
LAEEVLALTIEARASMDDAEAAALAAQYLSRYPNGRFVKAAEQVEASFATR